MPPTRTSEPSRGVAPTTIGEQQQRRGDRSVGPAIVIDLDHDGADKEPASVKLADDADDGPLVVAREVRPPLRRWAAGRALQVDPSCWGTLVQRAREVDPRGGAAIVHGLVDSIHLLAPAARDIRARRCRELASPQGPRRDDRPPTPVRACSSSGH